MNPELELKDLEKNGIEKYNPIPSFLVNSFSINTIYNSSHISKVIHDQCYSIQVIAPAVNRHL